MRSAQILACTALSIRTRLILTSISREKRLLWSIQPCVKGRVRPQVERTTEKAKVRRRDEALMDVVAVEF